MIPQSYGYTKSELNNDNINRYTKMEEENLKRLHPCTKDYKLLIITKRWNIMLPQG